MSSADSADSAGGGRYVDRTHALSDNDDDNDDRSRYSKRAKKYTELTIVDKDENPAEFKQFEASNIEREIKKILHQKLFPADNDFSQNWTPLNNFDDFNEMIFDTIRLQQDPNDVVGAKYGALGDNISFFTLDLPFVFDSATRNKEMVEEALENLQLTPEIKTQISENCLRYMVTNRPGENNIYLRSFVATTFQNLMSQLKDHPKYNLIYKKFKSDKNVMLVNALNVFADLFYRQALRKPLSVKVKKVINLSEYDDANYLGIHNKVAYILKLFFKVELPDWKTKVLDSLLDVEFENDQFNAGAD